MKFLLCLLAACATAASHPAETTSPYPATRRTDVADTLHGVRVADSYRWLEEEKSPEVQAWMKAQDDFARDRAAMLARGVHFREAPRHEAYGTVAVFDDLYGNGWDLIEPKV